MTENTPVVETTEATTVVAKSENKPVRRPRPTKPAKDTGVVGAAPLGFEALRDALRAVNATTDMRVDAIRADVKRVTRAMIATAGDKPAPPAGRGRWTGLRTYDFQNTLFALNDRADWRFSDRTLCVAWAVELAANKCDFPAHARYVASTRTDYVNGRHGTNVVDAKHRVSHVWPVTEAK